MYTQCPECRTAFRVSAKVLQQAAGKVRCGGCEHVFSALEFLSEDMPAIDESLPVRGDNNGDDKLAESSRRLMETLDELAGPEDVRIEDTGIEWRVLEEAEAGDDAAPADARRQEEIRYDDNTPLPDGDDEEPETYVPPAVPQRREADFAAVEKARFEELQGDLALSEPEDWTELLDEVRDADALPLEVEEELADIHHQLSAKEQARDADTRAPIDDLDAQFDTQAEALGLSFDRDEDLDPGYVPRLDEMADDDDASDDDTVGDNGADFEAVGDTEAPVVERPDESGDEQTNADGPELQGDNVDYADERTLGDDGDDDANIDREHLAAAGPGSRESTGEFEEQIDIAARALSSDDVDEEGDDDFAEEDDAQRFDAAVDDGDDESDEFASAAELAGDDIDESGFSFTIVDDDSESLDELSDIDADLAAMADDDDDEDEVSDNDSGKLSAAEQQAIATSLGVDDPSSLFDENSDNVETIIMEGDFVRSAVEAEQIAAESSARGELDDPKKLVDTYALSRDKIRGGRRRGDPPGYGVIAGVGVLALVLAGQFVHNMRESLATYGFFNQAVAPVYEVLGKPVTPEWNIKGWQFESTSGSIDDADTALRIVSRISNGSDTPLPYPLVHVALTDRYEEIMGSRVLEPREYLAGDVNVSRQVLPGENFTAVIGIADPAPEATGFKLNVCYRVASGTVRCATEDFKN